MTGPLFCSFRCKSLDVRNRIVMAPMTRRASPGGLPTREVVAYYRRRAAAEVGLILSEGTAVDRPGARHDGCVPNFFGAALPVWAEILEGVRAAGGHIAPQLWHVGARPEPNSGRLPLGRIDSPSGFTWEGERIAEPSTEGEIEGAIEAFAASAAYAAALGFSAVEIHAGHGYLVDQFFWQRTNRRSDRWGGATLADRSRFAIALVDAVRRAVPRDMVLILRLSQDRLLDGVGRLTETPAEMERWLQPLVEAGVDILHCSALRHWRPEFAGSDLTFAGWAKKLTGVPTITVGAVGLAMPQTPDSYRQPISPATLDEVERRLDRGEFDLVAVGRALLADPHWVEKIRAGRTNELIGFEAAAVNTLW